jgi:outer membrane protein OmpA-like peptidoglycan-associated protein
MRKKFFLYTFLLFLISTQVGGAQAGKLRKAQQYMETLDYQAAIDTYKGILEKGDVPEAIINLAEAYRKAHDYINAEIWYSKGVDLPQAEPVHFYYYGLMLQRNGNCEQAKPWYRKFLNLVPYDHRRKALMDPCGYQEALMTKNSGAIRIGNLPFNGPFGDLGPAFYGNGLVFASARRLDGNSGPARRQAFFDLFYVDASMTTAGEETSFVYGDPVKFSGNLNSQFHEAIVTFNEDQSEIFFTRNQILKKRSDEPGIVRLEIMSARAMSDGSWGALEPLPFNSDDYSVAHPSLTSDGRRLFFSSDMPGGFGGKDIYVSSYENGSWSPPVNLGPGINTEGDELYPNYESDGRLYFSSDGHFGLGGQDIYFVADMGDGTWNNPENIGYPINTPSDDFGIIFGKGSEYGFFTSNRSGGAGSDDIYSFYYIKTPLEEVTDAPIVLEEIQEEEPVEAEEETEQIWTLSGVVMDRITGLSLEGATIKLLSDECSVPEAITTDGSGYFYFTLQPSCCYRIRVEKGNYFTRTFEESVCPRIESETREFVQNVGIQPFVLSNDETLADRKSKVNSRLPEEDPEGFQVSDGRGKNAGSVSFLLKVYYDLGRTSVQKESVSELKKLLKLLQDNSDLIVEIGSHTDSRGSDNFNQQLSQRRAQNIVTWLISMGIPAERLVAKGYGESRLVNDCSDEVSCSEDEHQRNRRTEFTVLGLLK